MKFHWKKEHTHTRIRIETVILCNFFSSFFEPNPVIQIAFRSYGANVHTTFVCIIDISIWFVLHIYFTKVGRIECATRLCFFHRYFNRNEKQILLSIHNATLPTQFRSVVRSVGRSKHAWLVPMLWNGKQNKNRHEKRRYATVLSTYWEKHLKYIGWRKECALHTTSKS